MYGCGGCFTIPVTLANKTLDFIQFKGMKTDYNFCKWSDKYHTTQGITTDMSLSQSHEPGRHYFKSPEVCRCAISVICYHPTQWADPHTNCIHSFVI